MKRSLAIALLIVSALFARVKAGDSSAPLSDSLARKVAYLRDNGMRQRPDQRPTVLTDQEVDAYMNSGRLKVPPGISDIHLTTTVGEATGTARIDFDRLTRDVRKNSMLWELFAGVHDVRVRCGVWGKDGMGNVHVQNVWLDGHEIPRVALEFFLDHYLKPRVPQASLDSRFRMPARIQTATVTSGKTTLVQR